MDHSPKARPSLSQWLAVRTSLRQQEVLLQGALREVQRELRGWQPERQRRGKDAPSSLRMLWLELEERERQLCMDLLMVQQARVAAAQGVQDRIAPIPKAG